MGRAEDLFEQFKAEGVVAIDRCILERQSEELFLDFKRSGDNGGDPKRLHDSDRKNLAKAVSGFANSEGGVIVWGVDCSQDFDGADVARARKPIQNIKRFVSRLEGAVSGCTSPPHRGIVSHPIPASRDSTDGFAVTLIPKIVDAPIQNTLDQKFYIRAGSSFMAAGQGQILSLFARRSEPLIFPMWHFYPVRVDGSGANAVFKGTVVPVLANHGPGLARDLYLSITLWTPNREWEVAFEQRDPGQWDYRLMLGIRMAAVMKDGVKVAPKTDATPFAMRFMMKGPFTEDLRFRIIYGHGNGPVMQFASRVQKKALPPMFDGFLNGARGEHESTALLSNVLGFDQIENQMRPYYGNIREPFV